MPSPPRDGDLCLVGVLKGDPSGDFLSTRLSSCSTSSHAVSSWKDHSALPNSRVGFDGDSPAPIRSEPRLIGAAPSSSRRGDKDRARPAAASVSCLATMHVSSRARLSSEAFATSVETRCDKPSITGYASGIPTNMASSTSFAKSGTPEGSADVYQSVYLYVSIVGSPTLPSSSTSYSQSWSINPRFGMIIDRFDRTRKNASCTEILRWCTTKARTMVAERLTPDRQCTRTRSSR